MLIVPFFAFCQVHSPFKQVYITLFDQEVSLALQLLNGDSVDDNKSCYVWVPSHSPPSCTYGGYDLIHLFSSPGYHHKEAILPPSPGVNGREGDGRGIADLVKGESYLSLPFAGSILRQEEVEM